MQNLPVSIFSPSPEPVVSAASSESTATTNDGDSFTKIFDNSRNEIFSVSPLSEVEQSSGALLNRMGNTLFTGGTRLLNANINRATGLFSSNTHPRIATMMQGNTNGYSSFIESDRIRYSGLPSDFDALTLTNGTLSHDDVNILKGILKGKGAQEASIEALNQLMASGNPLTVSTVTSALTGQSRLYESLTDDERSIFRLLGNKMGITTLEGDDMLALSDAGKSKELWNKLAAKIGEMENSSLDMSRKDVETFLKGLDISPETRKFVLGQFPEGEDQITLSKEKMDAFFSAVRDEITRRDNAQAHCLTILASSIVDALAQRKLSQKTDPLADYRGNAAAQRLEARMQESTLQKNDLAKLDTDADDLQQEHLDKGLVDEQAKKLAESYREGGGKDPAVKTEQLGTVSANIMSEEKNAPLAGLNSVEVQMPGSSFTPGNAKNLEQLASQYRQEIFQQVQTGMLKNIPDGTTQITLQLDPKDLGQLSLILTSREGEIRATIRAENAETAAVLSEQLQHLKATLEEQGIKVAELEVKTGLHNETGQQNWQGTQEHNQMYDAEQRSRAQRLAQLRTEKNSAGQTLQTHHTQPSPDGLHIVA